jgi:hypothetical protein
MQTLCGIVTLTCAWAVLQSAAVSGQAGMCQLCWATCQRTRVFSHVCSWPLPSLSVNPVSTNNANQWIAFSHTNRQYSPWAVLALRVTCMAPDNPIVCKSHVRHSINLMRIPNPCSPQWSNRSMGNSGQQSPLCLRSGKSTADNAGRHLHLSGPCVRTASGPTVHVLPPPLIIG